MDDPVIQKLEKDYYEYSNEAVSHFISNLRDAMHAMHGYGRVGDEGFDHTGCHTSHGTKRLMKKACAALADLDYSFYLDLISEKNMKRLEEDIHTVL